MLALNSANIAVLGNLSATNTLYRDRLTDYALLVSMPRINFFNSGFNFTYSAVAGYGSAATASGVSLNSVGIKNGLGTACSVQYGSKCVFNRYAFPLGVSTQLATASGSLYSRAVYSAGTTVQLYSVFMDATGMPVPSWKQLSDGSVEVYYEYFCDPSGSISDARITTASGLLQLPTLMGVGSQLNATASGIGATLVCNQYPYYETTSGNFYDSTVPRSGTTGVCKLSASGNVQFYHTTGTTAVTQIVGKWPQLNDADRNITLVRAHTKGYQTLVYALLTDATCSTSGATELVNVMRYCPSGVGSLNGVMIGSVNLNVPTVQNVSHTSVASTYRLNYNMGAATTASFYSVKVAASGALYDSADAIRGRPMFLPPVFQSVQLNTDAARTNQYAMPQFMHKILPLGNTGQRLMQLTALLCTSPQAVNPTFPIVDSSNTPLNPAWSVSTPTPWPNSYDYDLTNLGAQVIMSREPEDTMTAIVAQMVTFFNTESNRNKFLEDFNNKYNGILRGSSGLVADAISSNLGPFWLMMFVDLHVNKEVLNVDGVNTDVQAWTLPGIPIVFQLV